MFWIAKFDTRNALTSLSGQSLHFHDGALSCGKGQGLSRHGDILIFKNFIFFISGTGTEEVRQMYRKAAGPSWYRRKFMNSTLEMNLKTASFGNGSGQCLDPRGAKLQVLALSPGAYDSLRSLYKGEAFVQALQGSSSDECCITRLTCRQWQEMARASIHFLIRWFL